MPKPQERNQEETKVIFQSWLEEKLTTASDITVEILGGPENTGFSNETLSFRVSYSLNNENLSKGMVLRFYPEGFFVFPAGPALATIKNSNNYFKAIQKADLVFFYSGFFVLLLKIFKNISVNKFSGFKFLNLFFI